MSSQLQCQATVNRRRSDYNSPLLQYANQTRNKGYFEDVTVGAGESNFSVNRMVLSCYSKYFEEKFQLKEDFHQSLSIKDIDGESVKTTIDFIYSGEVTIDQDNVINLIKAGHKLKVIQLKEFCFEYLESVINSDNCFYLLTVANLYENKKLKSVVYLHMSKYFDIIIQRLEFKQLSKQNLIDFLTFLNQNQVGNMKLQYEAMISWTKFTGESRKEDFPDLFQLLDLDQLPRKFLLNVVSNESLVHENASCSRSNTAKLAQLVAEKQLKYNKSSIVCIGGWKTRSQVKEVFNLLADTPKQYPDLPFGLDSTCSVIMDNNIICIGGNTNENWNPTSQVWQMDLRSKHLQWKEFAAMNEKRCRMGVAVYQDTLIVAGGYDKETILNSTEIITKQPHVQKAISELREARRNCQVIASKDCLFALGGFDGKNTLSTVEKLDGLDKKWQHIHSMITSRSLFAAVACQNKIFAIGGKKTDGLNSVMKSVEMFDHSDQKWTYVDSMNFERCGHSACVLKDKIFVVGGINSEKRYVKEIECYEVTSKRWTIVASTIDEWLFHSVVAF